MIQLDAKVRLDTCETCISANVSAVSYVKYVSEIQ